MFAIERGFTSNKRPLRERPFYLASRGSRVYALWVFLQCHRVANLLDGIDFQLANSLCRNSVFGGQFV